MVKLIKYETRELPRLRIIGNEIVCSMKTQSNPIPAFWDACFAEGMFKTLEAMSEFIFSPDYVGYMTDWDEIDGNFSYIIGMLMKPDCPIPNGYSYRDIETTKVGIGWIQGKEAEIYGKAQELTQQEIEKNGLKCTDKRWCMELYNCPRFTNKDENGEVVLDYYIPVE